MHAQRNREQNNGEEGCTEREWGDDTALPSFVCGVVRARSTDGVTFAGNLFSLMTTA